MTESLLTSPPRAAPAQRLRTSFAAIQLSFQWLGLRKALPKEQRVEAARVFGASEEVFTAAKRLLDAKHPKLRALTSIKGRMVSLWKGLSLPYPEPGIRLIRRDQVQAFDEQMQDLKSELHEAVDDLDASYDELRDQARQRLGDLFNPRDYPDSLRDLFQVEWSFPSVEPPSYLRQLDPTLYEQESRRVSAQFEQAVELAEQAFLEEFRSLVTHLADRLRGDDGQPRIFRDSSIENVREFFERFRSLNLYSHQELDELVQQTEQLVGGVDPRQLRQSSSFRQGISEQLGQVSGQLDELMEARPRRQIQRTSSRNLDEEA